MVMNNFFYNIWANILIGEYTLEKNRQIYFFNAVVIPSEVEEPSLNYYEKISPFRSPSTNVQGHFSRNDIITIDFHFNL